MNKRKRKKHIDKILAKAGKEMAEDASRLAQINEDGSINRLAEVLARRTNTFGQLEMIIRMDASIPEHLFDRLVDADGDLFGEFRLFDSRVITAPQRKFISYIVDFCLDNDIGLAESPLNYVDDIKHYLIKCLWTRKCALCGKKGQVHHVDAVGAGRNRKKIDHTKHHLMSLCIGCHEESHKIGQQTFMRKHHVVGVIMNQEQYEKLNYKG